MRLVVERYRAEMLPEERRDRMLIAEIADYLEHEEGRALISHTTYEKIQTVVFRPLAEKQARQEDKSLRQDLMVLEDEIVRHFPIPALVGILAIIGVAIFTSIDKSFTERNTLMLLASTGWITLVGIYISVGRIQRQWRSRWLKR